jgi:membrane-associated PAP2 superfamily phosphatase
MNLNNYKWLTYTVLVGLIPILLRLILWIVGSSGLVQAFAATDFVAFGLVVHVSIINELEHTSAKDRSWKTVQNGTSIMFIALYSGMSAIILLAERTPSLINQDSLVKLVSILAGASLLLGASVQHRFAAATKGP